MGAKRTLFIYPGTEATAHDLIPGFGDSIPMTRAGIARNFEVVGDPRRADYFFMGQVPENRAGELRPERFEHFVGRESHHLIDLDGDWRDSDHPDWLRKAVIVTGHVRMESKHKFARRFARPVVSPLMLRMIRSDLPSPPFRERGFWFQGQMDFTKKQRDKVRRAFELAKVPGEFRFNPRWGLHYDARTQTVIDFPEMVSGYMASAERWSYALCPIGEGPTCRFYEMALFGRVPVLIADYEPFGENQCYIVRWSMTQSAEQLAQCMREMIEDDAADDYLTELTGDYRDLLRKYFKDPTAYLLEWLGDG